MSRRFTPVDDGAIAIHENGCAERRRKFAMKALGIGATVLCALATVGVVILKYVIAGAFSLELDRRFPHTMASTRGTQGIPSLIHEAQAADMPATEMPK